MAITRDQMIAILAEADPVGLIANGRPVQGAAHGEARRERAPHRAAVGKTCEERGKVVSSEYEPEPQVT